MNQASLSYVAFGVLVAGGVPLKDLPEIAEIEAQPVVEKKKKGHSRNLLEIFRSNPVLIKSDQLAA